jgi:tetratricopeptide (TPR) repeat protein
MKKTKAGDRGQAEFSLPAEPIAPTVAMPRPRPQTLSIEQALALASQHQEAGRLPEAENILKKILQAQPGNAHALHTLGIVAHMAGKTDLGAELLGQAIRNNGKVALFHANRAEMLRLLKRLDEAVVHGKKAVALDPKMVSAHSNLGIAYYDQGEFDKAEKCQKAALTLNPDFPPALNNMGSILREREDRDGAMEYYRRAARVNPNNVESLNNLGTTLTESDRADEALKILDQALAKNPRYAEAHCNRGFAYIALEKYPEALPCFETALRIRPEYAEAYQGIARVFKEVYELDRAETFALKGVEIDPELAEGHTGLGAVYLAQGHPDKAQACFEKALALEPGLPSARMGLGNIYLEAGRFKEAEEIFGDIIDNKKERIGALFSLAQTKKVKPGDRVIAMVEDEAKNIGSLPESKSIYVHFALGKIHDDLGDAGRAFPHFIAGCRIKRSQIEYDAAEKDAYFSAIKKTFSKSFIKDHKGHGDQSNVPIFVLGMPRSGTTLTEQIIASHPEAFGAGELFDLINLAQRTEQPGDPQFPANMNGLTPQGMAEMGRIYAEGLQARKPGAKKITDKMPINFVHVGLIHLILPHAKIVHVNRNPLDTCISCFTRLFAHNQNQTYDLRELGRFYKGYDELMKYWRAALPKGAFYDVQYEALVDDTEAEAKRLIDYCGLDWNESCLAFHENKRNIRTASLTQVRQPIYKTSVARWKKYEKFLGPLIEGLGDAWAGEE